MKNIVACVFMGMLFYLGVVYAPAPDAVADSKKQLERSAREALRDLYRTIPAAAALGSRAAGVLVFPEIVKGGFVVAGQYGDGVLFKHGEVSGFYNTTAASFGFQAGLQKFSYALIFMSDADIGFLGSSGGWEIGALPSLTVVDVGIARSLSTTTIKKGIYAFFFGQKGLMGGLSLQGTKITRINPRGD